MAGNPMVQAVVNDSQTVDTVNPSTVTGAPVVTDPLITDTDDGKKLEVSFTFSEAMDTGITPTVTFDPAVATTLTNQTGAWQSDGKTFKVEATIADKGIDANEVTIDITGAKDVIGNLQVDHTAVKGLEVDTLNPTASYASEIKNQNTNGTADVSSDADSVVAYTVTFSEPVAGITPTDIDIAGGALVDGTLALIEGGLKAKFDVKATDDSVANLVVKVKDTVKDLNGNTLVESSSAAVTVDTRNPDVTIEDNQTGKSFDGQNTVAYTLTFTEGVQKIDATDLTVTGATVDSVVHTAGDTTATVNVIVKDNSMDNVSITAKKSIVDMAGNPMVQAVVNDSQTVDTVNPSTVTGAPVVTDPLITDTDDGKKLEVSFTFSEAMDTGTTPTVTFDPAVATTLTNQTGAWQSDGKTFKVEATVADKGIDANEVTIDITGAKDVIGNDQVDHTAVKGLEVDTLNPDKSTISIVVADNDQTDGDAATSFTVSTTDADPGTIHVDMRGSEYTELTSIHQSYIQDVTDTIGTAAVGNSPATGLKKAQSDAAALETILSDAEAARDKVFGDSGSSGFKDSNAVSAEITRLGNLKTSADGFEKALKDASDTKTAFFATDPAGPSAGFANSTAIGTEAKRLEDLAGDLFGAAKTQMSQAASALRDLETRAKKIEDDVTKAQNDKDGFFNGLTGPDAAFDTAAKIGIAIGTAAEGENAATGLQSVLAQALSLEGAVSTADSNLKGFLNTLNADAALNLKDGSDYTGSTSIGSEITALETLLNSTDSDNAADRVTDFFKLHNGTDKRDIDDLADLNVQITNSIVTRDIGVSDATAQTVKLTTAEVDRLGEGGVQIKATQTDGVGNLHEGGPASGSFVIDTIAPDALNIEVKDEVSPVDIVADVDDDGVFTVTTTFSEPMDQNVIPQIIFDPAVATTLTNQSKGWLNETTFVLTADIDDVGADADAVTVGVSGAKDVAGNVQNSYSAQVEFEVDTDNPTSTTVVIEVADNDQTEQDATTSFTVKSTDADPGKIHVDMRGSEHADLTSIKSSYFGDLDTTISALEGKSTGAKTREDAVSKAKADKTKFFQDATNADPSGSGVTFASSGDIKAEKEDVEGIASELQRLQGLDADAEKARADFFAVGGDGYGSSTSTNLDDRAAQIEGYGRLLRRSSRHAGNRA